MNFLLTQKLMATSSHGTGTAATAGKTTKCSQCVNKFLQNCNSQQVESQNTKEKNGYWHNFQLAAFSRE
jgi:hypothetical protein